VVFREGVNHYATTVANAVRTLPRRVKAWRAATAFHHWPTLRERIEHEAARSFLASGWHQCHNAPKYNEKMRRARLAITDLAAEITAYFMSSSFSAASRSVHFLNHCSAVGVSERSN
jgi:hypothetical protein